MLNKKLLTIIIISFTYKVLILLPILLFYVGCSSIYTVNKYPSKEKFYKDINNSTNGKTAKVVLKENNLVVLNDGVLVEGDSLYKLNIAAERKHQRIPLSLVKQITYADIDYHSAVIALTNNEKLNAEDLRSSADSLEFTNLITTKSFIAPVNKVKQVSYKNRWLGVPLGFAAGILAGSGLGIVFIRTYISRPDMTNGGERRELDILGSIVYGAASGAVIGAIIGWFVGYDYIYRFN